LDNDILLKFRKRTWNADNGLVPVSGRRTGFSGLTWLPPRFYKPSTEGTLVYFTAHSGDLSIELSRVEDAGGKVLQPKTQISPEPGFMALFIDSEGNRIALHYRQ